MGNAEKYLKDFQEILQLTQQLSHADRDVSETPPVKQNNIKNCIGSEIQDTSLQTVMHILSLSTIAKEDQMLLATRTTEAIESLVDALHIQLKSNDDYKNSLKAFERLIQTQTESIDLLVTNCTNMHTLANDVIEGVREVKHLREKFLMEQHQREQLFAFYDTYNRELLDVVKDFREFQKEDYRKFVRLYDLLHSWKGIFVAVLSVFVSGVIGVIVYRIFQ